MIRVINGINNNSYSDPYQGYTKSPVDGEETPAKDGGVCQTCKERKYIDGSDEMVSFKSAAHISPESSASRVRAHEGEHVANAYNSAAQKNGKVVNVSVSLHTAVCPECGRTYVSGGTTTTMIKYNDDKYAQNAKKLDKANIIGKQVDVKQ